MFRPSPEAFPNAAPPPEHPARISGPRHVPPAPPIPPVQQKCSARRLDFLLRFRRQRMLAQIIESPQTSAGSPPGRPNRTHSHPRRALGRGIFAANGGPLEWDAPGLALRERVRLPQHRGEGKPLPAYKTGRSKSFRPISATAISAPGRRWARRRPRANAVTGARGRVAGAASPSNGRTDIHHSGEFPPAPTW
jgi:hypothetical protein